MRDEFEGEDIVQDALINLSNNHEDFESLGQAKKMKSYDLEKT